LVTLAKVATTKNTRIKICFFIIVKN